MSYNIFGHVFKFMTWGESHGPAIGCVVDGCPPNLPIDVAEIQKFLDLRKPGKTRFETQRQEADLVKILSGVFENEDGVLVSTGTPISLMIENTDQRSKDYGEIKNQYRPGHADFTYQNKYGIRDHRGGGRSSARETAMRVAAGGVARQVISDIKITGALVQIGDLKINYDNWDDAQTSQNPFFCPDAEMVPKWETYLDKIRKSGSSVGAVIEIRASNVPVGLGAPIYAKLDQDLASAMMSINAVKSVEIGAGSDAASLTGEENADQIRLDVNGEPVFLSNNAGGILGGISSGQDVVVRFAVKPTSSILTKRQSIDKFGKEVDVMTKGRHDPCVGIRAVPVGEAMMAVVLADHFLLNRAQNG
ncbi:MAG: chorismate synthase [Hyphomicrobiales bacterium]